jgi:acyl-CoA dehydrogenase
MISRELHSRDVDSLLDLAAKIGREVAGPASVAVDRESRFPQESIDALREGGLLGALIPESHGGLGCTYADVAAVCTELGRHCGSTAMVFAMHQIQVACVVEHGQGSPYFDELMRDIATRGRLMASATTELGVGGDVRSSICAVESDGDTFRLEKNASVISYGEHVDDVMVTARRSPDSAASDQVIIHVQRPAMQLTPNGTWDAFGMRGTCSIGFLLQATGNVEQIIATPYSELSARTMLPVTHIFWASLWVGIADGALAKARTYIRSAARKNLGTIPPGARHLVVAQATLDEMRATVEAAIVEFEHVRSQADASFITLGFSIRMNELKLSASTKVVEVVQAALLICGIAGYRNDTPFSLGRELRDAHSAALMVHNDRITEHNASLLCVAKEDRT